MPVPSTRSLYSVHPSVSYARSILVRLAAKTGRALDEWVAALRPLHDTLIEGALRLRDEVKICPCQTIVPLYRNHVIAQIKPATNKRIDFGLALKGAARELPSRL